MQYIISRSIGHGKFEKKQISANNIIDADMSAFKWHFKGLMWRDDEEGRVYRRSPFKSWRDTDKPIFMARKLSQ